MSSLYLFDTQALSKLAPEHIYKQGLLYFKQDRVISVFEQDKSLFAQVEGSDADFPYDLELSFNPQDKLVVGCDCEKGGMCKHAVAALLAYTDELSSQDTYGSAMDNAIKDRIKRGQTEVQVKHLSGHPVFGTWQAISIVSTTHWQRSYQVEIRSLDQRINYCNCPDLANNQLGTCKHIEAALHQISKSASLKTQKPQTPQTPFVYLSWQQGPKVKVQRTASLSPALQTLLDQYFDAQGEFKGSLPADFFAFQDHVFGSDEIAIGTDVRLWLEHQITEQEHQLKAQQIRQQIKLSGGQMPGVNAKLYPYQEDGVAFLAANGRALLADDMGLGKTLQAISAATWLAQNSGVKRTLIICPASLKYQWAREIEKFTGQQTQIIQGGPEKRQAQYRQDKPFFVLNYELLLRDLSIINEQLNPDLIILDEAQRIKNWRTKIASAVKLIRSDYAFVLTGTPLENRLEDLYSLMQVVDPKVLGPLWRYMSEFHICDEKGKVLGYRNLSELRQRLEPVMLRRNRSIVSDQLPGKIVTQIDVPMSNKQQELHDTGLSGAFQLAQIAKRRPLTPSEHNRLMAALQQARMACNAAGLVDKKTQGSPKLKELKNLIQEFCLEGGLKLVIFSQWKGMTMMIEELVQSMAVGYVHLNGQVPTHKRGELMEQFQHDDATCIFISTDAGGSGLNLQAGSVVINMDVPWNPAVLEQRNARVHRLGQSRSVQIILMVAADSYEERVLQLVKNKQLLFDNVVAEGATEDVVGLSKQSVTTVINELNQLEDEKISLGASIDEPAPLTEILLAEPSVVSKQGDEEINGTVESLQLQFGQRITQILAKAGGLLVILDAVDSQAESFVEALNAPVPVALIDLKTQKMLQRLGESSPIADAQPLSQVKAENIWFNKAEKQLSAAKVLLEQELFEGVIELLCASAIAWLTGKAELTQQISAEEATVWIYSQGLAKQLVSQEQAMEITRILSLRFAATIPTPLLQQAIDDLQRLIR